MEVNLRDKKIEWVAKNIVNQLYDLAGVPVKKRQSVNDRADEFVIRLVSQLLQSQLKEKVGESLERVRPLRIDKNLSGGNYDGGHVKKAATVCLDYMDSLIDIEIARLEGDNE